MKDHRARVCRNDTLARSSCGSVQRCADCGALSLHVGPVTMRIDLRTAEALWTMLGEALHRARERPPEARTAARAPARGLS